MSNNIKILACFKTVADLEMLTHDDWLINDDYSIASSFVRKALSNSDENALETALQLADSAKNLGLTTELTALTIGDDNSDSFLKNLYAVNYHKAVAINIASNIDLRFNPLAIATLISHYREQIGQQDIIILGNQSDDGQNGQTAMLLAEKLNWPCITQVTHLALTHDSTHLMVTSVQDGLILQQSIKLPLVLAMGYTPEAASLRLPNLKSKLSAAKKDIERYGVADFNLDEQQLNQSNDKKLVGLLQPHNPKSCVFIEGKDAQEKAQRLYLHYLKPRLTP